MKLRPFTTLVLILAVASPAAAYTVKGSVECPDVIREDANEDHRKLNMWWILGYFSGRNYARSADTGAGEDAEHLYDHVLTYCRKNLGKDMDDASIEIYDRLR